MNLWIRLAGNGLNPLEFVRVEKEEEEKKDDIEEEEEEEENGKDLRMEISLGTEMSRCIGRGKELESAITD